MTAIWHLATDSAFYEVLIKTTLQHSTKSLLDRFPLSIFLNWNDNFSIVFLQSSYLGEKVRYFGSAKALDLPKILNFLNW